MYSSIKRFLLFKSFFFVANQFEELSRNSRANILYVEPFSECLVLQSILAQLDPVSNHRLHHAPHRSQGYKFAFLMQPSKCFLGTPTILKSLTCCRIQILSFITFPLAQPNNSRSTVSIVIRSALTSPRSSTLAYIMKDKTYPRSQRHFCSQLRGLNKTTSIIP